MIQIAVTAIRQDLDLETSETRTFLVCQHPNGKTFTALVTQDVAVDLMQSANVPQTQSDAVRERKERQDMPTVREPAVRRDSVQPAEEEVLIEWENLSDEVLSAELKNALRSLNAPHAVSGSVLRQLVTNIHARFTPTDWANAGVIVAEEPVPPPPPTPVSARPSMPAPPPLQMPLNEVTFSSGVPRSPAPAPKSVSKDDYGNPIISGFKIGSADSESDDYGASQF